MGQQRRLVVSPAAETPVKGCLAKGDPGVNSIYFIVTLLARGQAECLAGECAAEALVAQKLGSFGPLTGGGSPGVPLTSRSTFPPGGTAEVVPNPNGGGTGVPISGWLNGNLDDPDPLCADAVPIDADVGSWSTCERHEWYGVDIMPDENSPNGKYTCPTANCSCDASERRLSDPDGIGIDMVIDPEFPCDLFEHVFHVDRADYQSVKDGPGVRVIKNCDDLGADSRGTYWVDGSVGTCDLSGKIIGSPDFPVFIISAATLTKMVGNTNIFGVLFVTDVEGTEAGVHSAGDNTIYGAVLIEGPITHFQGTYQIVYNDDIIDRATKSGALGKVYGGWTDFHEDWR